MILCFKRRLQNAIEDLKKCSGDITNENQALRAGFTHLLQEIDRLKGLNDVLVTEKIHLNTWD